MRGDPTQQIGTRLPISLIFPIEDIDAWKAMVGRYKTDDHGIVRVPDYATLTPSSENQYVVATFYGDVKIGEYRTGFMKAKRVTCKSGVMHLTFAPEETRSDYGPNHVTTDDTLQIDSNGDLIVRRSMDVEYHARLLHLPMGTGHFFEEYAFRVSSLRRGRCFCDDQIICFWRYPLRVENTVVSKNAKTGRG